MIGRNGSLEYEQKIPLWKGFKIITGMVIVPERQTNGLSWIDYCIIQELFCRGKFNSCVVYLATLGLVFIAKKMTLAIDIQKRF